MFGWLSMALYGPVCLSKEGGVWWAWTCNCPQQVLLIQNCDKRVYSLQSGLRTRYNILQFPEVPNLSQHIAYCLWKVSVWQQTLRLNHRKSWDGAVHWARMNLCHLMPIPSSVPISSTEKRIKQHLNKSRMYVLAAAAVWRNAEHSCDACVDVCFWNVGLKFLKFLLAWLMAARSRRCRLPIDSGWLRYIGDRWG